MSVPQHEQGSIIYIKPYKVGRRTIGWKIVNPEEEICAESVK